MDLDFAFIFIYFYFFSWENIQFFLKVENIHQFANDFYIFFALFFLFFILF